MNITTDIERYALETPEAPALFYDGSAISFSQLDKSINRTANGLKSLGIETGDRVALMLPNIPEFVYTFYACQKIGAVAVPFNTMYKGKEISHILRDSGAKAILCLTNFVPLINELHPQLPDLKHIITTGERTVTFADPDATLFVQTVVKKSFLPDLDTLYRKTGETLTSSFHKAGLTECWYNHRGSVRLCGKKIAGFYISEIEDIYIINALCFMSRFDPTPFFNAIWVPPEIKDKIVEPLTSVDEHLETPFDKELFCSIFLENLRENLGIEIKEGTMSREEIFGYQKQRSLIAKSSAGSSEKNQNVQKVSESVFSGIRRLLGKK